MAGGLQLQTLSSFTPNSTLHRLPPHSNPSPQLPTQVMQQVFECLAWARDWPQLLDSRYLNFSWLIQASPLFWKLQGLPISLAALTSSLLPWSLFLRSPSGARLRPLFFHWACFHEAAFLPSQQHHLGKLLVKSVFSTSVVLFFQFTFPRKCMQSVYSKVPGTQ